MKRSIWKQIRGIGSTLLCACVLAACVPGAPLQKPQPAAQLAPVFPASYYLQAEAQGKNILRVDSGLSLLVFEVRRAGPFAHLGHDHVVASHDVTGFVSQDEGRADLSVPLDRLAVDEAALRTEAGFNTQPTPDGIAGTRRNMLTKVLQAERFPVALIHVTSKGADKNAEPMLNVSITLHGVTRTFDVPASMQSGADGMVVNGRMHFRQSDFGIVPFSILNGAIQVQDRLDLRFHIVAAARQKQKAD